MPCVRSISIILLFVLSALIKAQDNHYTDSLTTILKTAKDDTVKTCLLNDLTWEFMYNDPERAINYSNTELALAKKLNFTRGVFDSYTALGNAHYIQGDYTNALSFHKKALAISEEKKYQKGLMIANSNIGTVYHDLGAYPLQLEYCLKALKIAEGMKDTVRLAAIYSNVGSTYRAQKNYDVALGYFNKTMAIHQKRKDERGIAGVYINVSSLLMDQQKYKEALIVLQKALLILEILKDNFQLAKCYSNIGQCYEKINDYSTALTYLKKGLEVNEKLGSSASLAGININTGIVYNKLHKGDEALKHFNTALSIAKETGHKKWQMESYLGMSYAYETQNNLKKAYESYYNYSQLRDSLVNEDYNKQIASMQVLQETERKESEINTLKQNALITTLELEQKNRALKTRNIIIAFTTLAFILFIIAIILFTRYQKIKSKQKQILEILQTEENERIRIAKDIHDDLGSGLSKIKFLSEIISSKASQIPEINSSIKAISETSVSLVENMRDLIWALNPENTSLQSLVARMREYASDYLHDFPIELNIDATENFGDKKITKEAHRNLFFIVKECLQNIVKHSNASMVTMKVDVSGESFNLTIKDNGKGLQETGNDKGNGLRNIKQRAEMIGATTELESNGGMSITITVPIRNMEKT
ncbi:MAG: tetratricopeptide repeat-containing sensor histidine kinase [Bacteroidia bacterium]